MSDIDKIICCEKGGDNDAALWATLANRGHNYDPMAMAAMMNGGGMGNQWNNPFIYLVWMMFAQRMWNNNGYGDVNGQSLQNAEIQNQLQAMRTQMQDNQNSGLLMDAIKGNNVAIGQLSQQLNCDFNTLNSAICDVRGGIDRLSGQVNFSAERVINAVNMGDCHIIQALKDCCCENKQLIQRMGYENQLAQKDILYATQKGFCDTNTAMQFGFDRTNSAIERGFGATAYETQRQTCDIINAGNANTQRIIDTLNSHWSDESQRKIQDLKFELSQERQNNLILNRLSGRYYDRDFGCGCGQ